MSEQCDALISVQGKFVDGMLRGTKRVELRRRRLHVAPNTRLWIYSKAPVAAVTAMVLLSGIERLSPRLLWERYESVLDLTHDEYERYVGDLELVTALQLGPVFPLRPVSLATLREHSPTFHPPQFYLRLERRSALLPLLIGNLVQPG